MNIINKKPNLFEKSDSSIWTDPYIQEELLNAHLELSSDAASRNMDSIKTIVDFISRYAKPNSRLLDLGCGPGLYTNLLANKGYIVTGIDLNAKSIEYAKSKNENITYIESDYIRDFPHGEYDTIIMIYCDMGTYSNDDRDLLLANCYNSLCPGGILIFDVFNQDLIKDKVEGNNWEYENEKGFWANQEYLLLNQTFHYPESKAFAYQYNLLLKDVTKHFIIWDRYYDKAEVIDILKNIGFRNLQIKDNLLEKNSFTSNNQMFIVAEK